MNGLQLEDPTEQQQTLNAISTLTGVLDALNRSTSHKDAAEQIVEKIIELIKKL